MMAPGAQRYRRLIPLVLVVFGFALYHAALRAPFVYDDRGFILLNPSIRTLASFLDLSGTRYVGFLSFALNYAAGGLNAFDYHLVNVLVHIANSLLVFSLVKSTFTTPVMSNFAGGEDKARSMGFAAALAASALFLCHPVQTQAVTYITQRFASLATMFYLMAVFFYVKARLAGLGQGHAQGGPGRRAYYIAALVSTVLAMKTKEISFTIPFVIVLYDYMFFGRESASRASLQRLPIYLTLLIIPLSVMGLGLFGSSGGATAEHLRKLQLEEAVGLDRYAYTITQFGVILTYLRLLFLPVGQKIDYDWPLSSSIFEPATLASFVTLAALLVFSVYVLRRSYRRSDPWGLMFSFGVFFFYIALSVESFVVPIQDVIFEQRVYLPGTGFFIAVTAAFLAGVRYLRGRAALRLTDAAACLLALVLFVPPLSYATHLRNLAWGDELKLLNDAIGEGSTKGRLYYVRSMVYIDRGQYDKAIVDADRAIALEPDLDEAYNMRGFARLKLGEHATALADLDTAIALGPDEWMYYYNRGLVYSELNDPGRAISDYSRSIALNPGNPAPYNNRGVAYAGLDELALAGADLKAACSMGYARGCDNLKLLLDGAAKAQIKVLEP